MQVRVNNDYLLWFILIMDEFHSASFNYLANFFSPYKDERGPHKALPKGAQAPRSPLQYFTAFPPWTLRIACRCHNLSTPDNKWKFLLKVLKQVSNWNPFFSTWPNCYGTKWCGCNTGWRGLENMGLSTNPTYQSKYRLQEELLNHFKAVKGYWCTVYLSTRCFCHQLN